MVWLRYDTVYTENPLKTRQVCYTVNSIKECERNEEEQILRNPETAVSLSQAGDPTIAYWKVLGHRRAFWHLTEAKRKISTAEGRTKWLYWHYMSALNLFNKADPTLRQLQHFRNVEMMCLRSKLRRRLPAHLTVFQFRVEELIKCPRFKVHDS